MYRVKLIDVANKAGVSKSTASQYLNGRFEYMSENTRELIRKAIEELDYVPNPIARSLKTQKTNTIGVMVNNITGPITSNIIRGIDDYCKKLNYNVLIYNTDYIPEIEKKSIENLKSLRADGIILTSSGQITELLNSEYKNGLPIVHINRSFKTLDVSTVLSDYKKGSYDATKYLIELGHKNFAIFTREYENIPSRADRLNGCIEAIKDDNLNICDDSIYIIKASNDIKNSYNKLMSSDNPPTVIFSMYSAITIDLLDFLNEKNIKVPEDISVFAFDDLPLAHLLKTPLTVMSQQSYKLGEKSAELLLSNIANKDNITEHIALECKLIIRDSCKKIPL